MIPGDREFNKGITLHNSLASPIMFDSTQDQQSFQDVLQNKQPNQAGADLQNIQAYGLNDNNQLNPSALSDQLCTDMAQDPWSTANGPAMGGSTTPFASRNVRMSNTVDDLIGDSGGSTLTDSDGDTLIQGGDTTDAEQDEVDGLLSQRRFNRDGRTRGRGFRNLTTRTGSFSADERGGFDRTDSRRNAFNLGGVVYRQSKNVRGKIGYTYSGNRDKNDWFKFYAGKSGTYNFSLRGLSKNAGLALYNRSGSLIKFSDRGGSRSEVFSKNLGRGTYYARAYSYKQRPWSHGATSYSLSISKKANSLERSLTGLIRDKSVENAALNSIKYDNSFSRNDVIGVLKSAGDYGSVTGTELSDLRKFWNRTDHLMRDDIKVLSEKVVFHDDSNQWYTGSDSIRDSLGDLAAGSSKDDLNLLIGKHMLGTDRPAIHRNGSGTLAGSYSTAAGTLTDGSVSADDVGQGSVGTCYFLAGLAGTANDKPSAINDMFTDNGDGTWTVRFNTNGKVDYVTVDRQMATRSDGTYLYANDGGDGGTRNVVANNNELWVALAEKAYAQVNESGRIGQDGNNFYGSGNTGIGWGSASAAIGHITGIGNGAQQVNWSGIGGINQTELVNMVNSNRVVTVSGFNSNATNANAGTTSISTGVQGHVYSIVGYNSTTERFDIRNPWDSRHLSLTHFQLRQLGAWISYSNS